MIFQFLLPTRHFFKPMLGLIARQRKMRMMTQQVCSADLATLSANCHGQGFRGPFIKAGGN